MKKLLMTGLVLLFLSDATICGAVEDIEAHPECILCGMDRAKFAYSRVLFVYEDGETSGFCSIHCAVIELNAKTHKAINQIRVGDYDTHKLIDAEKATWVLGGAKPGVMTRRAKWAFERREDAEQFVKKNGGIMVDFRQALAAAGEDASGQSQ